jgi:hypothetical protein
VRERARGECGFMKLMILVSTAYGRADACNIELASPGQAVNMSAVGHMDLVTAGITDERMSIIARVHRHAQLAPTAAKARMEEEIRLAVPGKYSPTAGSTSCINCGTGTYVNVTGATTCETCRQDSCPFPGTFEIISCTPETNKVCEVCVPNIPTIGKKIVTACLQTPFMFLICYMVFKFTKSRSVMKDGENWKWTVFSLVIGVNDVVSDFTTLSLIPTKNTFFLFWVSLASLLCSVAASIVLSFYSRISLPWTTRACILISGTAEDFRQDWQEKWNSRVLLCVKNLPQLAVQAMLLYLQGPGAPEMMQGVASAVAPTVLG